MAANSIERHGQETGWRVTESGYTCREAERNGRSCSDKRNSEAHSNASNTTQDTTDVTIASVQQTNKTRGEGDTWRLNAEKVIMSNMEVSDVKERRKGQMVTVRLVTITLSQAEASEVLHQACKTQVCRKIYTNMWAGIAQSV